MRHFAAAQHAFRSLDLDAARTHLEQVQKYAPHHVGARNGMAKIRQQEADIEYAKMAWELAHAGKKLVAAKRAVEAWRKLVDPSLPEVQRGLEGGHLGPAPGRGACGPRARKLERVDPPAARSLYRKSLDIAADLPEALAGLNRCPPDAPTGLETAGAGGPGPAFLDAPCAGWPGAAHLRRSCGSVAACPQHPGDGTRIAEVSTCEFEDRHVKPGETVSYAVLAKRGEAESLTAVAVGPLIYLPDVQDVRVEPRAGEIELSWVPPHGVFEIRVVRKPVLRRPVLATASGLPRRWTRRSTPACGRTRFITTAIYAIYRMADWPALPSHGRCGRGVSPVASPSLERSPADDHPERACPAGLDRTIARLGADSPHDQAAARCSGGAA